MKLNKDEFIVTKMTIVRKTERQKDKKTDRRKDRKIEIRKDKNINILTSSDYF